MALKGVVLDSLMVTCEMHLESLFWQLFLVGKVCYHNQSKKQSL